MKLFRTVKSLLMLPVVLGAGAGYAGEGSGKILEILAHSHGGAGAGVIMFKTEHNANKAACSVVDGGRQWAFALDTEHGRAMYGLLLLAQAQGKPIVVSGAGDCSAWGDRERPNYISFSG